MFIYYYIKSERSERIVFFVIFLSKKVSMYIIIYIILGAMRKELATERALVYYISIVSCYFSSREVSS